VSTKVGDEIELGARCLSGLSGFVAPDRLLARLIDHAHRRAERGEGIIDTLQLFTHEFDHCLEALTTRGQVDGCAADAAQFRRAILFRHAHAHCDQRPIAPWPEPRGRFARGNGGGRAMPFFSFVRDP
jgi:hypothetical protein